MAAEASIDPTHDWRDRRHRADRAGVDAAGAPRSTSSPLHLEDLLRRGPRRRCQRRRGTRRAALAALDESPFAALQRHAARSPERLQARRPTLAARGAGRKELQRVQCHSPGAPAVPPASDLRARHRARARPRHRRRDDRLHRRRFRGAAAAALRARPIGSSRSGTRTPRRGCRTIRSRRSTSWTTARCRCSTTRRRGGGPASTSSIPGRTRCASTPSRSAATCSTCWA